MEVLALIVAQSYFQNIKLLSFQIDQLIIIHTIRFKKMITINQDTNRLRSDELLPNDSIVFVWEEWRGSNNGVGGGWGRGEVRGGEGARQLRKIVNKRMF